MYKCLLYVCISCDSNCLSTGVTINSYLFVNSNDEKYLILFHPMVDNAFEEMNIIDS